MDGILDHVMMRVEDLEESLDWYTTHFDYEESGRWEAETFTNVYLEPANSHADSAMLELTHNHDGRSYELGDGWGHIAVRTNDVHAAYEGLMDEGVADYRDPESCPGNYAFVKDPDGHEIEIVQRDHGAPWSIDHTMVRVPDADSAIGWYARKLEYEMTRRFEMDEFALYFMKPPNSPKEAMSVELTYNYDRSGYTMGDAWGHLAVRCDDLQNDWETLMGRHAENYRDPESCDNRYAFTKTDAGHEVEILEQ